MISLGEIKELLDKAENPLVFFDDDPDGLCSYMLLMKYLKRGNGIVVKNSPTLDENYVIMVRQHCPDLVVVVDKPIISQEFVDKINVPIVWIDHHPVVDIKGVNYFNPRFLDEGDERPTTYWCYKLVNGEKWVALLGIIADWSLEDFDELSRDYKELFDNVRITNPNDALFNTRFGELIKIVAFCLKGGAKESYKFIGLMMGVNHPLEILEKSTENGRKICEKFEKLNKIYTWLLEQAMKLKDEKMVVFNYVNDGYSFTGDLANELMYGTKAKMVFVGREDNGEIKASVRNRLSGVDLNKAVRGAIKGLNGYGGGHKHAAGCCVKKSDFDEFIERLKKMV